MFLDYIMKLNAKNDITVAFEEMFKKVSSYCNMSEKSYSYPISVIITIKYFKRIPHCTYWICRLVYRFKV